MLYKMSVFSEWYILDVLWCALQMYWVGPLLGGMLAGLLYDLLFATNATLDKAKSLFSEPEYADSKFDEQGRRKDYETLH